MAYYQITGGDVKTYYVSRQYDTDGEVFYSSYQRARNVGVSKEIYEYWTTYRTYGMVYVWDASGMVPEPSTAGSERSSVTITLETAAEVDFKVGVLTDDFTAMTAQQRYTAVIGGTSLGQILTGATQTTVSLNHTQAVNFRKYGYFIIPTQERASGTSYELLNAVSSFTFTYEVENLASPGTLEMISPADYGQVVSNEAQTITYKYSQPSGAAMAYLGVRYTDTATGETTTFCKKTSVSVADGGTGTFTIPANTLTGSTTYTFELSAMPAAATSYYTDSDEAWLTGSAEVTYRAHDNPATSSVTCDGKPSPTLSWTSSGQTAYQVKFDDWDSGAVASSTTSCTVPRVFEDGVYAVQVRTATSSGEWSAWTTTDYVTISNTTVSGSVTLTVAKYNSGVKLSWTSTVSSPDNYAILRNGELIAVTTSTSFVDKYGNGTNTYEVLAMVSRNYCASNVVAYTLALQCDVLSEDEGATYYYLRYTPDIKEQSESLETGVSYAYYSGRTKPIYTSSNQKRREKYFTYIFKSRSEAIELRELEGTTVLIKTTRGDTIYGVVAGLTCTDSTYPIISFTVRETDREGEYVEYSV